MRVIVKAESCRQFPVHLLRLVLHQLYLLDHLLDLVSEDAQERELDEGNNAQSDHKEGVSARLDPVRQGHDAAGVVVPVRAQGRVGAPLALHEDRLVPVEKLLLRSQEPLRALPFQDVVPAAAVRKGGAGKEWNLTFVILVWNKMLA